MAAHPRGYRDATAAREHLHVLRAAAWSLPQIAAAASVSVNALDRLPRRSQVQAATEQAILAITGPPPGRADATGTRRRVQALAWLGWPASDVAALAGCPSGGTLRMQIGQRTVPAALAARVARVYRDLWGQPGPSAVTAARARRRGWPSPLAWDDIDHDRPRQARKVAA